MNKPKKSMKNIYLFKEVSRNYYLNNTTVLENTYINKYYNKLNFGDQLLNKKNNLNWTTGGIL